MILIVDDERRLADMSVEILALIGHRAMAVYSAEEAMVALQKHEFALVISDVVMPGANGIELAIEVRRLWPNIKILLVSGNAATQEMIDAACAHGHTFELLAKPVAPKELLLKVVSMVNGDEKKQQYHAAGTSAR